MSKEMQVKGQTAGTLNEYTNDIIKSVQGQLEKSIEQGLRLPADYSPYNALLSAINILVDAEKDDKPLLSQVTPSSVRDSLHLMLMQGLTPAKKQGYFIPRGNKLTWMTSYFGEQTLVMRADPNIKRINSMVVYIGDEFSFEIEDANMSNIKHRQDPDNIDVTKIKGAYATAVYNDGDRVSLYMTKNQIDTSWSKAKTKNVQKDFPEEMSKRTVIKRLAKNIVNTSSDYILFSADSEEMEYVTEEYEELEAQDILLLPDETEQESEVAEEVEPEQEAPKPKKTANKKEVEPEPVIIDITPDEEEEDEAEDIFIEESDDDRLPFDVIDVDETEVDDEEYDDFFNIGRK